MTRFYDGSKVLNIHCYSLKTGEDFAADFFEDGCNPYKYNETLYAYKVEDVQYLVDFAEDYLAGTNPDVEYPDDWEPDFRLQYDVTDRESMSEIEAETAAASLFAGDWRAADKDQLQKEYDLTDKEAEMIAEKLAEYEK